jgi:phosphate transport system permease protein
MSSLRKPIVEKMTYAILFGAFGLVLLSLILILGIILYNSLGTLSLSFLLKGPTDGMTKGGIFPMLIGTLYVTLISAIMSVPFGIATAIYLNEYADDNFYTRLIRLAIRNLAAVPSIVYGLFGLAIFVKTMNLGTSVLSAGLTLGLLSLPVIISASEEALRNVPAGYKDGAFALGLTQWQVIRKNVIPVAMPGILTGIILGISRAMGETAPILFTGVAFFLPDTSLSLSSQFMALPYHLYIMSTQHHDIDGVRGIAYSTAAVLIILSLGLNIIASIIRFYYKKGQHV